MLHNLLLNATLRAISPLHAVTHAPFYLCIFQRGVLKLRKRPLSDAEGMERMNSMRIVQSKDNATKQAILEHADRKRWKPTFKTTHTYNYPLKDAWVQISAFKTRSHAHIAFFRISFF